MKPCTRWEAVLVADGADNPVYALAGAPGPGASRGCVAASHRGLFGLAQEQEWLPLLGSLNLAEPPPITAVALSPDYGSDGRLFAGTTGAILRSFDRGISWEVVPLPAPPPAVVAIAASPDFAADGVVFAGTAQDGIFRSADRGARWVAWNFGLLDLNILCLAVSPGFVHDETVFAGTVSGVYRSTNGGRAWRETAFPAAAAPVLSLALSPDFPEDRIAWAGTEEQGLFTTSDGGDTWRCALGAEIGSVNALAALPNDAGSTSLLVLTPAALLRSDDGGATWTDLAHCLPEHGAALCLAAPPRLAAGAHLFIGTEDGRVCCLSLP